LRNDNDKYHAYITFVYTQAYVNICSFLWIGIYDTVMTCQLLTNYFKMSCLGMILTMNFKSETNEHKKANYRPNSLSKLAYFCHLSRSFKIKGRKHNFVDTQVRSSYMIKWVYLRHQNICDISVQNEHKLFYMYIFTYIGYSCKKDGLFNIH
jgi:hypothetical protein